MNTFLFRPKVPCLIPFWDSISYPTVWNSTLPFTIPVSQGIGTIALIYNSTPSFFGTQHWPLPFRMGPKPSSLQEETLLYRLCHYWHCWYGISKTCVIPLWNLAQSLSIRYGKKQPSSLQVEKHFYRLCRYWYCCYDISLSCVIPL